MSELFGPIFGATAVTAATDDRAWLGALCEVEIALARACARVGRIELATALEIGAAADELSRGDPAELGRQSVDGADPVQALVATLRQRVGERAGAEAAAAVHLGASSQDVLDTAAMLVSQRALGVILAELGDCAAAAAELARVHRSSAMIGRTLPQQAPPTTLQPTTFGALAAVWGNALDRAVDRLSVLRDRLPAQLGGPDGTLAAWHPHGLEVAAALADELDLAEPDGVWHTDRSVLTELAGALGAAAAAIATTASDIVRLAQPELDEVRESTPDCGAARHPQHPVAAVTARSVAAQAAGLVATLLASGAHAPQSGTVPWPAEWPPLVALLRAVGGSSARLRTSLTGLIVDTAAMRRNLAGSEVGTGHAEDLVDRYLARRTR